MRVDRSDGGRPSSTVDTLAGAVSTLLRSSRTVACASDIHPRGFQRQRPEVHAGDAGSGHRAGVVSVVSTFHYTFAVGCGPRVAPPLGGGARTHRRPDPRRDQLSQTRPALGGGGAA